MKRIISYTSKKISKLKGKNISHVVVRKRAKTNIEEGVQVQEGIVLKDVLERPVRQGDVDKGDVVKGGRCLQIRKIIVVLNEHEIVEEVTGDPVHIDNGVEDAPTMLEKSP